MLPQPQYAHAGTNGSNGSNGNSHNSHNGRNGHNSNSGNGNGAIYSASMAGNGISNSGMQSESMSNSIPNPMSHHMSMTQDYHPSLMQNEAVNLPRHSIDHQQHQHQQPVQGYNTSPMAGGYAAGSTHGSHHQQHHPVQALGYSTAQQHPSMTTMGSHHPYSGAQNQSLPAMHSQHQYSGAQLSTGPPAMPVAPPNLAVSTTSVQANGGARRTDAVGFRRGEYQFKITVEQQPVRARMCGFGDKDRRPITPPPCVKLSMTYADTGKPVDLKNMDPTFFVLTVDLWNDQGTQEVNLVRHSNNSPSMSISASSTTSFPPAPERFLAIVHPNGFAHAAAGPLYSGVPPMYAGPAPMGAPDAFQYSHPAVYGGAPVQMVTMTTPQHGMFTRNLIGSLAVNATKLVDDHGDLGLWFVLQDLSVRTEGSFRLKMSFIDVGDPNSPTILNTGTAPVLATCYSDSFQVYSAKKFPGVIESTPLSKAFAGQGIKIPIRKDAKVLTNQDEYDADDQNPGSG